MQKDIVYVGVDVDDTSFHGSAFFKETGEILEFKCRPTINGLEGRLAELKRKFQDVEMKVCYEATHIGFTLQRELDELGYCCEVVAPSSIPKVNRRASTSGSRSSI